MDKRFLGLDSLGAGFRVEITVGSVTCKFVCVCSPTPTFPMDILPDGNRALQADEVYLNGELQQQKPPVVLTPDQVDELVEWVEENAVKWSSA